MRLLMRLSQSTVEELKPFLFRLQAGYIHKHPSLIYIFKFFWYLLKLKMKPNNQTLPARTLPTPLTTASGIYPPLLPLTCYSSNGILPVILSLSFPSWLTPSAALWTANPFLHFHVQLKYHQLRKIIGSDFILPAYVFFRESRSKLNSYLSDCSHT